MCGITGFLNTSGKFGSDRLKEIISQMSDTLIHRGPNDSGTWVDAEAGVALGHRRLAIIDISAEGRQPMVSASGRYVISFNGEIYNFKVLRRLLEQQAEFCSPGFRGHSDTEVMLAAIDTWGLQDAVRRFTGMFAFALWDRKERLLHLVRDRLGEKPLYYGWIGKNFTFASELKALRKHPDFQSEVNREALALYMRYSYIPTPHSIYKGINKLQPGTILTFNASDNTTSAPIPYWSFAEVAEDGLNNPFSGTEAEAVSHLDKLLREVINQQMVADVPLGAFLSGGIDSSLVVAIMQAQSRLPVKTFTIGFNEADFNEAEHAKAIARHLGTDYTELYVTPQEAMDVIPQLPNLYDEPFSDSSQIPTFLVAALARNQVTVSLSGDGGDELFGGYNQYFLAPWIWNKIRYIPLPCRKIIAKMLKYVSAKTWSSTFNCLSPFFARSGQIGPVGDKIHKLAGIISAPSPRILYHNLRSLWKDPEDLVQGAREPSTPYTDISQGANLPDFKQLMMFLDTTIYLPDDILVKVDRASMGVSLESRIPLLDHRVVEFAWKVPLSMKMLNGQGKWLLRQALFKYVPRKLIERPKKGFAVPIGTWLRGPLKEWAQALLDEKRLQQEGFLNPHHVSEKWLEHLSGKHNHQHSLWSVLMFQAWLEQQ